MDDCMHYHGDKEIDEHSLCNFAFSSVKREVEEYSRLDIHRSGDIGLNNLCAVLVQLELGAFLVLGVTRLLSVGLAMLVKDDSLKHIAAGVPDDSTATNVSLANVRVTILY